MSGANDAFDALMGKHAISIPVANPLAAAAVPVPDAGPVAAAPPPVAPVEAEIPEVPWVAPARPGGAGAGSAMRVSDIIGDEAEYVPPAEDDGRTGAGAGATEADLEPVADALFGGDDGPVDEVDAARSRGARVAGRDAGPPRAAPRYAGRDVAADEDDSGNYDAGSESADPEAGDDSDAEFRDAAEVDDDSEIDGDAEPESASASGSGRSGADAPGLALGRARRVKRFAYLPLSGAEAFDAAARDMLARLPAATPERPSLAITSAVRGEGRTELALRLALAMARRVGAKILLADFDLRRPQVAARLGVSTKYFTLADALRGSCSPGEAMTVSEEENLYVLPARAADREGDEILDVRAAASLISRLHAAFDFTILDCGPVDSPETTALAAGAGSVVLAGYCGRSSSGAMRLAAAKLTAGGARVAGLVLAGA